MGQETRNVYKIYHSYTDNRGVYIAIDNNSVDEVADLIVGLEFYIEMHAKYDEYAYITVEMAVYFLCKFHGAILVDQEMLSEFKEYDEEAEDVEFEYWIDLYEEREQRCGPDFHKYIDKIEEYTETEYVKKLCAFFTDDTIFNDDTVYSSSVIRFLSVEEIMENYEV